MIDTVRTVSVRGFFQVFSKCVMLEKERKKKKKRKKKEKKRKKRGEREKKEKMKKENLEVFWFCHFEKESEKCTRWLSASFFRKCEV